MARGAKKKNERKTRKLRYPNGYGSVHMLSHPEKRRKPFIVQVPNGMKTYKAKDGTYKTQYAYRTLCYTETWEEGDQILRDYNNKLKYGNGVVLTRMSTFEEIHDLIKTRYEKDLGESAKKAYRGAYAKHLKPLHKIPINEIKAATVQHILDDMRENLGLGGKTIWNAKFVCMQVFSYAYENDLIDKNYGDFLDSGSIEKAKEKQIFTRKQVELLFKNDQKPYVDTILIYIFTGMRLNELLTVKRTDLHMDEGYLVGGLKTEAGKNRIIPIHPYIRGYIEKWMAKNTEYLITDEHRLPIKGEKYDRIFKYTLKQLQITGITNHCCRHTLSTMFDNANVNKVAAQKILGHKSKDLDENTYIHKSLDRLIEAMNMVTLEAL